MGVAFLTDADEGLTVTVWHGDVSAREWRAQVETLVQSRDWQFGPRFLSDIRTAGDVSSIDDDDVNEMADRFAEAVSETPGIRVAVVAADLFDGARGFELEVERHGVQTGVFGDVGDACAWLGVDQRAAEHSIDRLRRYIRSTS